MDYLGRNAFSRSLERKEIGLKLEVELEEAALGQGIVISSQAKRMYNAFTVWRGVALDACGFQQVHVKLAKLGLVCHVMKLEDTSNQLCKAAPVMKVPIRWLISHRSSCPKCTPIHLFDKGNEKGVSNVVLNSIHSFIQEFIRHPFKKSTQRRPQPSHGDT